MKKALLAVIALGGAAFSLPLHAIECGQVVDEANVLKGVVNLAPLANQNADVHVVTVSSIAQYGRQLEDAEKAYEHACPSWAPHGQRKPNLIVFMVAPNEREQNIFVGSAFHQAFMRSGSANALYGEIANPYFRNGRWSAGVNESIKVFGDQLSASKSGRSGYIELQAFAISVGLLMGLGLVVMRYNRLRKAEATLGAQRNAIAAMDEAVAVYSGIGVDHPRYAQISVLFRERAEDAKHSPGTPGLSQAEYEAMEREWRTFTSQLTHARDRSSTGGLTDIAEMMRVLEYYVAGGSGATDHPDSHL